MFIIQYISPLYLSCKRQPAVKANHPKTKLCDIYYENNSSVAMFRNYHWMAMEDNQL
jgi:hypothetical protein